VHELLLAIIKELNGWNAVLVGGLAVGMGIMYMNHVWARASREADQNEFKRKMYELETERAVKLSRNGGLEDKTIDHRISDQRKEPDYG